MKDSDDVTAMFKRLPNLLARDAGLIARGRLLDLECLIGSTEQAFHIAIQRGQIVDMVPAPLLMRSWRFAYRATPAAWTAFWQPIPKAGWHDLLSLTKRGEATLEGDIQPFMTHLQYFKDLMALPRHSGGAS